MLLHVLGSATSINQLCHILYCIVLYCIVLYCIVLYCIVLYCIVLCTNMSEDPAKQIHINNKPKRTIKT